jgi:hypothetical protein
MSKQMAGNGIRAWVLMLGASLALAAPVSAQLVDFEDVPGASIGCFGVLPTGPVVLLGEPFPFMGGGFTCGSADVFVSFTGTNALNYNNLMTRFLFPCCPTKITLEYNDFGGQTNLRVNGELRMVSSVPDLAIPPTIGLFGAPVDVRVTPTGPTTGIIELASRGGCIADFSIGGQEFAIDNVRFDCPPCENSTDPLAEIIEPLNGSCVCGLFDVYGTAADPDDGLGQWELEYRKLFDPTWMPVANGTNEVVNDYLATWDTTTLGDGIYLLRLKVTNACGDDEEVIVAVYVDSSVDDFRIDSPVDGGIYGRTICVDGTIFDNCLAFYSVGYRVAGSGDPFTPVEPAMPQYFGSKINTTLATWDTIGQGIPDGDYEISVHAETLCGHFVEESRFITVDNTVSDCRDHRADQLPDDRHQRRRGRSLRHCVRREPRFVGLAVHRREPEQLGHD